MQCDLLAESLEQIKKFKLVLDDLDSFEECWSDILWNVPKLGLVLKFSITMY
jgi:hypothetical protein